LACSVGLFGWLLKPTGDNGLSAHDSRAAKENQPSYREDSYRRDPLPRQPSLAESNTAAASNTSAYQREETRGQSGMSKRTITINRTQRLQRAEAFQGEKGNDHRQDQTDYTCYDRPTQAAALLRPSTHRTIDRPPSAPSKRRAGRLYLLVAFFPPGLPPTLSRRARAVNPSASLRGPALRALTSLRASQIGWVGPGGVGYCKKMAEPLLHARERDSVCATASHLPIGPRARPDY
jgi:hypothetical protein